MEGPIRFSDFIPALNDTPVNSFYLQNVSFVYQNCDFDTTKLYGLTAIAPIQLDTEQLEKSSDLQTLYNVIEHVFGATPTGTNFSDFQVCYCFAW